jgi:glycosyltransferase involved in cell wall biosynthesis
MRIAVLCASNQVFGGIAEYLGKFLPAATAAGHEVGFWYERDVSSEAATIPDPPGGAWSVSRCGVGPALTALRQWQPEVLYAHGLLSPALEEQAYSIAPTVYFAHVYVGACISGAKTTWFPVASPCPRRFGAACLVHYFPRRCGGLNPLTMWRAYRHQSERLDVIRKCAAVVTHTEHMRNEYLGLGIPAERVFCFPFYVSDATPAAPPLRPVSATPMLLFLGRMEAPKGGAVLLEALPRVRAELGRPLRMVFAGDGRDRALWEARAAALQAQDAGLRIEFPGWVDAGRRSALLRESDLLVVPSVWPEPFGQVGPEAGVYGVPAAAFTVGGTTSWLTDGVNGVLAPGDPPTAAGLAVAVVRCLADHVLHQRLRAGAARLAGRFTWAHHYSGLMAALERAASGKAPRPLRS